MDILTDNGPVDELVVCPISLICMCHVFQFDPYVWFQAVR
jgi:hypothetical protein